MSDLRTIHINQREVVIDISDDLTHSHPCRDYFIFENIKYYPSAKDGRNYTIEELKLKSEGKLDMNAPSTFMIQKHLREDEYNNRPDVIRKKEEVNKLMEEIPTHESISEETARLRKLFGDNYTKTNKKALEEANAIWEYKFHQLLLQYEGV